ncbi:hypothetical protein HH310_31500 [Actinoplanes sp. TBRC 11911]|uniref:hypothetical protein n=1 Tax=Actinoplanes sp. TBRC 11911 TaxID=2729386 RepID=UPI00145EE837|nr:hypothetical protein [Actinoplanes sp. TBRC 11911]NMO55697.1 hypothetical protein [Actinoplanes sp. TBRC 11911]
MTAERVRDPQTAAVPRRFRRSSYQIGAVLSLIAAVQAVIVVTAAAGGAWLWGAAAVLAGLGVTCTYKSIPFGSVTFPPR